MPRHDGRIRSDSTFEDLVPTDDLAALAVDELLDTSDHIALEIMLRSLAVLVYKAKLLDLRLTLRTFLPACLRALIASDVDIFVWEEVAYL